MSELETARAIKVAEDAIKQMESLQAAVKATVNMTIELAKFSREKLNMAIIHTASGNNKDALMILADLRIRFDKFIEQNKGFPK